MHSECIYISHPSGRDGPVPTVSQDREACQFRCRDRRDRHRPPPSAAPGCWLYAPHGRNIRRRPALSEQASRKIPARMDQHSIGLGSRMGSSHNLGDPGGWGFGQEFYYRTKKPAKKQSEFRRSQDRKNSLESSSGSLSLGILWSAWLICQLNRHEGNPHELRGHSPSFLIPTSIPGYSRSANDWRQ